MKKSDLINLIKDIGDNDSVLDTLSKSDLAKSLAASGLTLDAFKEKISNDTTFKSFIDSEKDKHHTKALETWKSNNLQQIVDAEVLKATGKNLTPEQKKIKELENKQLEWEQKAQRAEMVSKYKDTLNEKKIPSNMINLILANDDDTTKANIELFENAMKTYVDEGIKTRIADGSYTPPGAGGTDADLTQIENIMMDM